MEVTGESRGETPPDDSGEISYLSEPKVQQRKKFIGKHGSFVGEKGGNVAPEKLQSILLLSERGSCRCRICRIERQS